MVLKNLNVRWWKIGAGCVLWALCMGSNCLNPCQQLATKICSCEPTEGERQACTRQATLQQGQRQLTNEDRLFCQLTLKTCECRALKAGTLEACGLARE